ncbi:MAG: glycosyltransferase [Dehalococcoidia bacterium]|nr:glycosyltransferase [Dehalococcoidia bacterium]
MPIVTSPVDPDWRGWHNSPVSPAGGAVIDQPTGQKLSSVSAFFPCYNDANTIAGLCQMVEAALKRVTDDYEIIVINDASTDDSAAVLAALQPGMPALSIVTHQQNQGYGGALQSGFRGATKDYVFYTDGDGQYDPTELDLLTAAMRPGVDVVNGYKISRQDPWYRQIIGSLYQHVTRILFSFPIHDVDCDFRLLRRSVFNYVTLESNDGAICIELIRKLSDSGFRLVELPVHHYARAYGTSQFFKPARISRALRGVARWYVRLVLLGEQKRRARSLRSAEVKPATPRSG